MGLLTDSIHAAHAALQKGGTLADLVTRVREENALPPGVTDLHLRDAITTNSTTPVWNGFDAMRLELQTPAGLNPQTMGQRVRTGRSGAVIDPAVLTGANPLAKIAPRWPDLRTAARNDLVRYHRRWAPEMPFGEFKRLVEQDLGTLRIEGYRNYFSSELWPMGPSTFDPSTFDEEPGWLLDRWHRRLLWFVFGLDAGSELPRFTGADLMKVYGAAEGHARPRLGDTWFWGSGEENGHSAMFLGDLSELHDALQRWFPNDNPRPGEPTFDVVWNHLCRALYADLLEQGKDPRDLPADDPRRLVQIHSLATGEGSHSVGERLVTEGVPNEVLSDSHRIGVILDTAGDYMELYPRANWASTREYFWHDAETAKAILAPLAAHDARVQEVIALIDNKGEEFLDRVRKNQVLSVLGLVGQRYGWSLDTGDHLEDDGVAATWGAAEGETIQPDTPLRNNQSRMDVHCSEVPTIGMSDAIQGSGLLFPDLSTIAVDFETGQDQWGFVRNTIRNLLDFDTFADVPQAQAMSRTALFVNGNAAGLDFYVRNMERSFRPAFRAIIGDAAYDASMKAAAERLDRDYDPEPEPTNWDDDEEIWGGHH